MNAARGSSSTPPTRRLNSDDGYLHVELATAPVPYHIVRCFAGEISQADGKALAMSSCRIACMVVDVVRGRRVANILQRAMTESCMSRLVTMSHLIENHVRTHEEIRATFCHLPAVPHLLDGMLVSADTLEMAVSLSVGTMSFWVSLVLKRMGSRWVCTFADIG